MRVRCWARWCALFEVASFSHRVGLVVILGLVAIATLAPGEACAGAPTDALRDFFGAVNVVLSDPTTEERPLERLRAIRRHVDDVFDFREAAMLALGREWVARTPTEQNEFVALFADLLERSFVWRVAGKATTAGGVKVDYLSEAADGETATVETAIAARDGNALRLGFRMVRRSERWVVRDIVMDGVSTMENYHAQFQRLVRDGSWPELVAQLRAKVGAPAGTVPVAATPPPMMWPSQLRAPDRVQEPMVPVPPPPVLSVIARPLETAVVPSRTAPYAAPPPTGPIPVNVAVAGSAPPAKNGTMPDRSGVRTVTGAAPEPSAMRSVGAATSEPTATGPVAAAVSEPAAMRAGAAAAPPEAPVPASMREVAPAPKPAPPREPAALAPMHETAVAKPVAPRQIALARPAPSRVEPRIEPPPPVVRPLGPRPSTSAWWVQVGAYRNASTAGRVAAEVHGEILVVATPADSQSPLLRVRVGPFTARARALARLNELQARGWRGFIAETSD